MTEYDKIRGALSPQHSPRSIPYEDLANVLGHDIFRHYKVQYHQPDDKDDNDDHYHHHQQHREPAGG